MAASNRAFLALYFGTFKVPIGLTMLLRAADVGIRSVATGVWLGLLTPQLIECLDQWFYTRGFPLYSEEKHVLSGWLDWEASIIEKYYANLATVLVAAGAGAGREVLALHRAGIRAVGYEYNRDMVEIGNRILINEGCESSLRPGEASTVPAGAELYDGIIIGWATYTLIASRAARVSLLKQARARCPKGAPLLLSFFHRSGDRTFYRASAAIANVVRRGLRRPQVELGDSLSVTYAHYFTEDEIRNELTMAGFRPVLFCTTPYAHAVAIAE